MGKCEKKKECAQPLRLPRESNSCFTPALSGYLATTKDLHHLILLLETFDLETRERVEVASWKVLVVSTRDGQAEPGDGTKRRTSKSEPEGTKASFGARAARPRDASARTRRLHPPWEMDSLIFKVRERRGVGFATWRVLVVRTKNYQAEPVYATKRRDLGNELEVRRQQVIKALCAEHHISAKLRSRWIWRQAARPKPRDLGESKTKKPSNAFPHRSTQHGNAESLFEIRPWTCLVGGKGTWIPEE
jgi:hypothetical protein